MRNTETVSEAKAEFLKWACEGWDGDSGDVDGALAFALESYLECGPSWTNDTFRTSFHLFAVPAWEPAEFHLLVSSALADHALSAYEVATKGQMALAAVLYADAVEAREHWHHMRGPAEARNKETRVGETLRLVEESFKRRELAIERKAAARKAAAAKLAKDPVQAAKPEVFKFWKDWQSGKTLWRSGAAFDRAMIEKFSVITATKTVERWRSEWSKQAKGK